MPDPTTDYAALCGELDEVLARPNDWPLPDDRVGYWVARLKVQECRAALEALARENAELRDYKQLVEREGRV